MTEEEALQMARRWYAWYFNRNLNVTIIEQAASAGVYDDTLMVSKFKSFILSEDISSNSSHSFGEKSLG